jgi:23S rRNA (cytosine1962-C5)-methyltransferase
MHPGAFLIVNTYSPRVTADMLLATASSYFAIEELESKQLWMQCESGKSLFYGNLLRAKKSLKENTEPAQ